MLISLKFKKTALKFKKNMKFMKILKLTISLCGSTRHLHLKRLVEARLVYLRPGLKLSKVKRATKHIWDRLLFGDLWYYSVYAYSPNSWW